MNSSLELKDKGKEKYMTRRARDRAKSYARDCNVALLYVKTKGAHPARIYQGMMIGDKKLIKRIKFVLKKIRKIDKGYYNYLMNRIVNYERRTK